MQNRIGLFAPSCWREAVVLGGLVVSGGLLLFAADGGGSHHHHQIPKGPMCKPMGVLVFGWSSFLPVQALRAKVQHIH